MANPDRRALLAAGFCAAAPLSWSAPALSEGLRGPFDIAARRRLAGAPQAAGACSVETKPRADLSVDNFYDRATGKIDEAKYAEVRAQTEDLAQLCWRVSALADRYMTSDPVDPDLARCALAHLDAWATSGGLLGRMETADSQHQRKWTAAGLSLAMLKIAGEPSLDREALGRVKQWLSRLVDESARYYGGWRRSSYNNHVYWHGLAAAATAVLLDDRARLDAAFAFYDLGVEAITPEGGLPLELARGERALNYHVFSLAPLVMMAEIGAANGQDLYGRSGGALHRLARRVLDGIQGGDWFEKTTGSKQQIQGGLVSRFTLSWAELWQARFPDPALLELLKSKRPILHQWLGGNLTLSFARDIGKAGGR